MREGFANPDAIADLFGAAIDDHQWVDFSRRVGRLTGIENMGVWILDGGGVAAISLAEVWRPLGKLYGERFSKIDPWAASLARAPLETVMLGYEHMREDELVKTEFYNEFARPGGMFRPMGVRMRLSPDAFANMGSDLPYGKTRLEEADKPRLRRAIPYVKRALQLRRRRPIQGPQASRSLAALDALAFGIVICDVAGRSLFVNRAAEAFARGGDGIRLGGNRLRALRPRESATLAGLIRDAAGGGPGGTVRLTGASGTIALLVLVTPLPHGLHPGHAAGHALVCLQAAGSSASFTDATLAALFRLSPAQASLARALYEGRSFDEIAAARGVRVSTLRTHYAAVLARTGATSLRELVRLLGSVPALR